jgi:integrase
MEKVDTTGWIMRLSRKDEKTKRPRTLALVANCERLSRGDLRSECAGVPFCRSSNGKPIKSFRRPFKVGFKNAGLEGITPHDMRRSAIRTFTKAGVGPSEGMAISGHRTNSVFRRYNIVDEEMQVRP